jgi:hypothetical protein
VQKVSAHINGFRGDVHGPGQSIKIWIPFGGRTVRKSNRPEPVPKFTTGLSELTRDKDASSQLREGIHARALPGNIRVPGGGLSAGDVYRANTVSILSAETL